MTCVPSYPGQHSVGCHLSSVEYQLFYSFNYKILFNSNRASDFMMEGRENQLVPFETKICFTISSAKSSFLSQRKEKRRGSSYVKRTDWSFLPLLPATKPWVLTFSNPCIPLTFTCFYLRFISFFLKLAPEKKIPSQFQSFECLEFISFHTILHTAHLKVTRHPLEF